MYSCRINDNSSRLPAVEEEAPPPPYLATDLHSASDGGPCTQITHTIVSSGLSQDSSPTTTGVSFYTPPDTPQSAVDPQPHSGATPNHDYDCWAYWPGPPVPPAAPPIESLAPACAVYDDAGGSSTSVGIPQQLGCAAQSATAQVGDAAALGRHDAFVDPIRCCAVAHTCSCHGLDGRGRGRHFDHMANRPRSGSVDSVSSTSSDSSVSSVGSFPDYDDIKDRQLPLVVARLQEWISRPKQQCSKREMKQFKLELGRAKHSPKGRHIGPSIDRELLKVQAKMLLTQWKRLRKARRNVERAEKKIRRASRKAERRERKSSRKEMKKARREVKRSRCCAPRRLSDTLPDLASPSLPVAPAAQARGSSSAPAGSLHAPHICRKGAGKNIRCYGCLDWDSDTFYPGCSLGESSGDSQCHDTFIALGTMHDIHDGRETTEATFRSNGESVAKHDSADETPHMINMTSFVVDGEMRSTEKALEALTENLVEMGVDDKGVCPGK
ncbi:hypothetical protein DCS_01669 [Drechmeria coniospora]|uniref:Uncharacterized protein n=1 Tax=Drechmeria coniospora TaxID=98403 RepID=A0A151GU44_DRECN|nr:hypothetical protein DCS_01669 [Drechmeria coniospora]KYK60532.1 hypothetical protein DCS_01669 [Drechmeria coniospora]